MIELRNSIYLYLHQSGAVSVSEHLRERRKSSRMRRAYLITEIINFLTQEFDRDGKGKGKAKANERRAVIPEFFHNARGGKKNTAYS